jgi:branched-chain amino acid transport system substrate-binding protein
VKKTDSHSLEWREHRPCERMPMMLPGITISTTPEDYAAFKALRIATFDGTSWTLSADPISAE